MTETEPDYGTHMEAIAATYGPKALALLARIRDVVIAAGYECTEPYDLSSDDHRWSMLVTRPGDPQDNGVDISVEIAEQVGYEGEDAPWGINFGISIVHYGGLILGGLMPYNFTEQCWVDSRDEGAVGERWAIVDTAEPEGILPLIKEGVEAG